MLKKQLFLPIALGVFLITFLVSCKDEKKVVVPKLTEGVIHFELSYPYYDDAFMASIMPDEMEMTFKNNVYRNHVSQGGLFSSTLIADCNKKELIMILDLGPKRIYCVLDKALTDTMLSSYPFPDIVIINEFDSVAGTWCERKDAIFDHLEDYDVELLETQDIDIKNSNWCNQYNQIEGVLMGYEIEQFGIQARMKAFKIDTVAVNDSIFMVPEGFKEVPLERMLFEMEEISKSFSY